MSGKNRLEELEKTQSKIESSIPKSIRNMSVDEKFKALVKTVNKQKSELAVKYRDDPINHMVQLYYLDQTTDRVFDDIYFPNNWFNKDKLITSLKTVNREDIIQRYEECKKNQPCQLYWCKDCLDKFTERYKNLILRHFYYQHSKHHRMYENEELSFIAAPIALEDIDSNEVKKLLDLENKKYRRIKYRLDKLKGEKWIEFVYEFEMVNPFQIMRTQYDYSNQHTYKSIHMKILSEHYVKTKKRKCPKLMLFVHWHGLTNLTDREAIEVFGKEYFIADKRMIKTHPIHGLYKTSLHKNKSIENNIEQIVKYPFKPTYKFKHNYVGFANNQSQFVPMKNHELGQLIAFHSDLITEKYTSKRGTSLIIKSLLNREYKELLSDYDFS